MYPTSSSSVYSIPLTPCNTFLSTKIYKKKKKILTVYFSLKHYFHQIFNVTDKNQLKIYIKQSQSFFNSAHESLHFLPMPTNNFFVHAILLNKHYLLPNQLGSTITFNLKQSKQYCISNATLLIKCYLLYCTRNKRVRR